MRPAMTDAQTEARAIAQKLQDVAGLVERLRGMRVSTTMEAADIIAAALAAKDAELAGALGASERFSIAWRDAERRAERAEAELAEAQEELNVLRANQIAHVEARARLTDQLAEARKALGEIEQEARSLPLHTSAVTREHVLTSKLAVVRDAARRALEAQGGENG